MTSRFAQYERRSGIPVPDPENPEKPENQIWYNFGHVVCQMKGLDEPISNRKKSGFPVDPDTTADYITLQFSAWGNKADYHSACKKWQAF